MVLKPIKWPIPTSEGFVKSFFFLFDSTKWKLSFIRRHHFQSSLRKCNFTHHAITCTPIYVESCTSNQYNNTDQRWCQQEIYNNNNNNNNMAMVAMAVFVSKQQSTVNIISMGFTQII
jgi:hypothetical protein